MYTRKQRWRRTRTRKQAWGDLPPELLDAMLAAGGGGMPKSVSWDHSYAAGLKIRADRAAEVAHRAAAEDSKLRAAAAAAAVTAKGKGVEVSIPRSASCSSLGPKRTLFARTSSSKDELGAAGGGDRRGSSATTAAQHRRRMLPHRRGVSFNTQVKMVLIPKREEFSELERVKLWWGREDYSQFRQVLIDWKRANAHRISHSDNILSINLSDIDEEEESTTGQDHSPAAAAAAGSRYTRDHEEAAAAAEATAQAAAAAKAAAEAAAAAAAAAAATTRAATAEATAAAAAAATAAEVAALNAEEMERERRRQALPTPPSQQQQQQLEDVVQPAVAGHGHESGGADAWEVEVAVAKAMAAAVAAAGGGIAGGAVPELSAAAAAADGDGLGDIPEGTDEGQKEEARIGEEVVGGGGGKKGRPCARASFSVGASGLTGGGGPDWSPNGGANGTFPLRRALTFGEVGGGHSPSSPADSGGGRLKEVPLSEAQAMAESLRAWRESFDVRNAFFGGESGEGDAEEDRGRAVSLQGQSRSFARRGRATALVTSGTKWTSDVVGGGEGSSSVEAKGLGLEPGGRSGGEEGSGAMAGGGGAASDGSSNGGGCVDRGQRQDGVGEKTHRTLSDQEWSSSRRVVEMAASEAASLTNPVMAAFERERKEAAARHAEVEEAQAARAAAMVKQAAAAAKAGNGEVAPAAAAAVGAASAAGAAEDDGELHVGSVVRLGLNDAPGSAAAASAAGLRIAAEGISNLSLRSRDSVENLQEMGEQSWGPLPLSSSA